MEEKKTKSFVDIEALLAEGKRVQIHPQGYSMYPLFVPGRDEVILEKTDPETAKRGDVLLYRRTGGILVLHRVYRHDQSGFYMVGDHQKEIEGPLSEDQIRGRMTGFIRRGRSVSVKNPWYVLYSRLWLLLRPFRPAIEQIVHQFRKDKFSKDKF